ncbi:MAG: asparagine synthase (glutamine-hydrolyzing) [Candidatus Woesearchaeota archaeon]
MCGIVGFYGEDRILLKQMTSLLQYRGPDQEGFFVDSGVSLGFRRLSIIDLSEKGNQPMKNTDESYVIIFNGEIYNYNDIKKDYLKNYRFESTTDTEVILNGYAKYGTKIFEMLNGIFGLAILDRKKNKLLIARDQIGVKPLYYFFDKKRKEFVFSSEIKAILLHPSVPRRINQEGMNEYFTFRYVPRKETIFAGIRRVIAGTYIELDLTSFELKEYTYWSQEAGNTENISLHDCVKKLKKLLHESVNRQLMSDVPLGIFLSGGLDSSAMTALTKKISHTTPKTFSIGFSESPQKVNELTHARKVAEYLKTDHHEIILEPKILWEYSDVIWHLEEPLADASTIPTFYISKFSKKWITVALTGEGGDEAFGGYVQYKVLDRAQKFVKPIPRYIRRHVISPILGWVPVSILTKFFDYPSSIGEQGRNRIKHFISDQEDMVRTYLTLISVFDRNEKKQLLHSPNRELFEKKIEDGMRKNYFNDNKIFLDQIAIRENKTWLPDWILSRLDKMTMAHSQEARVPLLDVKFTEYVNRIPRAYKKNKMVFRLTMKDSLPKEIVERKKFPFYLPIDSWFGHGYKEMLETILSPDKMSSKQYFNKNYIKKLMEVRKSSMLHSRQLWTILTFEVWHKLYIDSEEILKPQSIKKLYNI